MTSRWVNGLEDGADAPPHWFTDDNGDHFCLACRRERAVEIALESAVDESTEARAKLRSAAVVEFELQRDPERTEGEIARSARTSIGAVRKARKKLGV
jgi:hypothetical protein